MDFIMNTQPNYTREMPMQTRQKISQTMLSKNITRSPETRQKISNSLKMTWQQVPPKRNPSDLPV